MAEAFEGGVSWLPSDSQAWWRRWVESPVQRFC